MSGADPAHVAAWVEGWTISRGVGRPVLIPGGWRVEVGRPDQARRFVFPMAGEALRRTAEADGGPHVFIKAFAPAATVAALLPVGWEIGSSAFALMSAPLLAGSPPVAPANYTLRCERDGHAWRALAFDADERLAASGRLAPLGGAAVFDQIVTDAAHQRRGLGRAVMAELGRVAREAGATLGLLVATEDGRALYERLGWTVRAPYTSALWAGGC